MLTCPTGEAQCHGLFPTNPVHEQATNDTARQVEAIHDCSVANVLNKGPAWIQFGDDRRPKYAERITHEICVSRMLGQNNPYRTVQVNNARPMTLTVHEPSEASAKHWLPVPLENQKVRDLLLHSVLPILG